MFLILIYISQDLTHFYLLLHSGPHKSIDKFLLIFGRFTEDHCVRTVYRIQEYHKILVASTESFFHIP